MGGQSAKSRAPTNDPFYRPVPPVGSNTAAIAPRGGLPAYGTSQEYRYEHVTTVPLASYAGPPKPRSNPYGGRYAQGLNQIPGVSPWNYGNYYLGNTTMRMMPMMLNKVHEYGQIQAMSILGNAGLLGSVPSIPTAPIMPYCAPPSCSWPIAAPMMAAASALPVAFNPLVQGMYPVASMNPVNWMTPSSFMSALSAGPMPYRPPAFDFPSNVGMVMAVPYGTPNPWLSAPSFGGFNSSYNFGGTSSCCCCCYSIPAVTAPPPPPPVSYYPHPPTVPQPYPSPYPVPVPVPNVQQRLFQQPVYGFASPVVTDGYQSLSAPSEVPLYRSHGVLTKGGFGQPALMAFNNHSTMQTPLRSQLVNGSLPIYNVTDQSKKLIGQQITSNLSGIKRKHNQHSGITASVEKNGNQFNQNRDTFSDRFRRYLPSIPRFSSTNYRITTEQSSADSLVPPILYGQVISDSGWLPKGSQYQSIRSILGGKKRKQSLYGTNIGKPVLNGSNSRFSSNPHRRRHRRRGRSESSVSEYDCAICQQQREKRRLREHYGSSTVSSLLSSQRNSHKHRFSPNESAFSSISRTPTSYKHNSYKSHRRHPTKIKNNRKLSPPMESTSPVLLRQSPIQEQRLNQTVPEEEEEEQKELQSVPMSKQENIEKTSVHDDESSDQYESKISLRSIDE